MLLQSASLAAAVAAGSLWQSSPVQAATVAEQLQNLTSTGSTENPEAETDLSITQRVFFDIGVCESGFKQDRRLGDKSAICDDSQPLGRIVIGTNVREQTA